MGTHWVLFLLYLNTVLSWPENGWSRLKHVAKYNLIVIIASCLDVYCVLTVCNILYNNELFFWFNRYKIFDGSTKIDGSYWTVSSLLLLTESSYDATETDHASIIRRNMAKLLYSSNPIDESYLSMASGENLHIPWFCCALLGDVMMSL